MSCLPAGPKGAEQETQAQGLGAEKYPRSPGWASISPGALSLGCTEEALAATCCWSRCQVSGCDQVVGSGHARPWAQLCQCLGFSTQGFLFLRETGTCSAPISQMGKLRFG